jgi:predicted protein tyrosine phosphatase
LKWKACGPFLFNGQSARQTDLKAIPLFMLNVLFICSRNQWRSPTAEALYRNDPRMSVASAGTSTSARRRVTDKMLAWADVILVMENEHRKRLRQDFREAIEGREVIVLDIPDMPFMDPQLIELLRERTEPVIDDAIAQQA